MPISLTPSWTSLIHASTGIVETPETPLSSSPTSNTFDALSWEKTLSVEIEDVYFSLIQYQSIFSEKYRPQDPAHINHIYSRIDRVMRRLGEVLLKTEENPLDEKNIQRALIGLSIPPKLSRTLSGKTQYELFLSVYEILGLDRDLLRTLLGTIGQGLVQHIQTDIAALSASISTLPDRAGFRAFQATRSEREIVRLREKEAQEVLNRAQKSLHDRISEFRREYRALTPQISREIQDSFTLYEKQSPTELSPSIRKFLDTYRVLRANIEDERSNFTLLLSFLEEVQKKTTPDAVEILAESTNILMGRLATLGVQIKKGYTLLSNLFLQIPRS